MYNVDYLSGYYLSKQQIAEGWRVGEDGDCRYLLKNDRRIAIWSAMAFATAAEWQWAITDEIRCQEALADQAEAEVARP